MTRMQRVCADWISGNPPNPRHPRSISSRIETPSERLPKIFLLASSRLGVRLLTADQVYDWVVNVAWSRITRILTNFDE